MKKQILATGLACSLALGMVGCGSSPEVGTVAQTGTEEKKSSETTTTGGKHDLVMAWWGNQIRNERTQGAIDLYMEQNPDVTIEGQFAEWDGYWDKLATMASGGMLPDVFQQNTMYLAQYDEADLMLDLGPYVESGALDVSHISEEVLELGKVDGKLVAIPNGLGAWGLAYNATLLEANNIEIHDNMNVEDFINISREVYEKTGYKTSFAATASDAATILSHILRGEGYEVWQDGRLGVEKYEDLKIYFDIFETGVEEGWLIDPGVLVERNGNEQQPIVYGESPAERSWCVPSISNVYLSYVNAMPEGEELKLTTLPANNMKAANQLSASQYFSVSTQSKDPDAAVAYVNWLINSVDANSILLAERGVPANTEVVTAISGLVDQATSASMAFVNDIISPNCSAGSPLTGAKVTEAKDAFNQIYEEICYGVITSEEAAKSMFEKANEILKKD